MHKISISIIFFILSISLILAGCDSNEINYQKYSNILSVKYDDHFNINPLIPIENENITIKYEPKDEDNFKVITLHCQIYTDNHIVNKLIKPIKKIDGIYYFKFKIPEKSLKLSLFLENNINFDKYEKIYTSVILDKKNPKKNSIPLFMLNSTSYEHAIELFNLDKLIYPSNLFRLFVLYKMLLLHSENTSDIEKKFDSLEILYSQNKNNIIDKIDEATFYASLSFYFIKRNNIDKAIFFLKKLLFEIEKNINYFQFKNIDLKLILYEIILNFRSTNEQLTLRELDKKEKIIIDNIINIFKKIDNLDSYYFILKYLNSNFITENYEKSKDLILKAYKKLLSLKYEKDIFRISNIPDIFFHLSNNLRNINEPQKIIEINKIGIKFLKLYKNKNLDYSYPFDITGILASCYLDLSESYLSLNDTIQGMYYLKRLITSLDISKYTLGAKILSAKKLTNFYIEQNKIDSALFYIKLSYYYRSPYIPNLIEKINNLIKNNKNIEKSYLAVIENMKRDYFIDKPKIYGLEIETNKLKVKVDKLKDTILTLFFYNDECSICNLASVKLSNNLQNTKQIPHKEIYFSYKGNDNNLKFAYGNNITISNDYKAIHKFFDSFEHPFIIIIQNNRILYLSNTIPEKISDFLSLINYSKYKNN